MIYKLLWLSYDLINILFIAARNYFENSSEIVIIFLKYLSVTSKETYKNVKQIMKL